MLCILTIEAITAQADFCRQCGEQGIDCPFLNTAKAFMRLNASPAKPGDPPNVVKFDNQLISTSGAPLGSPFTAVVAPQVAWTVMDPSSTDMLPRVQGTRFKLYNVPPPPAPPGFKGIDWPVQPDDQMLYLIAIGKEQHYYYLTGYDSCKGYLDNVSFSRDNTTIFVYHIKQ